jgi:hypothetical protein
MKKMKKTLHIFKVLIVLILLSFAGQTQGQQVDILNQTLRGGSLPANWSENDIIWTTAAGGYARFSTLNSWLQSPVIDLSNYSNVQLSFDLAKYGTGVDGPLTVEISDDGGLTWTAQTFDSPTPSSSTYMTSGPTAITATGSQVVIRWSRLNSPSEKRLRDVVLTGELSTTTPYTTVTPSVLNGFTYFFGQGPSSEQTFTVSGDNLTSNISITAPVNYEISLTSGSGFTGTISLPHTAGEVLPTDIYVQLIAGLATGDYNDEIIQIQSTGADPKTVTCSGSVLAPITEPQTYPTALTASADSYNAITVTWTDSDGSGYLIKGSTVSYADISSPVDGVAESDSALVRNVPAGTETFTFTGLSPSTDYYFRIFPYNGSGTSIDYKNDLPIPESMATTPVGPELIENLMPQYMQGFNGTNNDRVPYAFRLTINNLIPNATYRYINQVITSDDGPTINGAGVVIYVNNDGTFTRASTVGFTNPGQYGEFTTDATGSHTGWFMIEPTGNARFTPGNEAYMRIRLNDGDGGTSAITYLTTTNSVSVINFGTNSDVTEGTAIRGDFTATDKNFMFLYDNTSQSGRPLYGTSIEITGIDFSVITSYSPFYQTDVSGSSGAWGGIIPNVNPNGVKQIVELSRTDGTLVNSYSSIDGIWGTANTVNPTGGTANVLVISFSSTPTISVSTTALTGFGYIEGFGPSAEQEFIVSGTNLTDDIIIPSPANFEISTGTGVSFVPTNPIILTQTGGEVTATTIYVRLASGLLSGNYSDTIAISSTGATDKTISFSGTVTASIVEVLLPMYMQGVDGTNNDRVPYAFRATLTDLNPNTTYRYINQGIVSTDGPTIYGAGNPIYVNQDGTFTRTTTTDFSTAGRYGEFTTDETGTYTGWFMLEATGNVRFTPGNEVFMRIRLNDGDNGTSVVSYYTSVNSVKVINFGTDADVNQGTAIRGEFDATDKNFMFLYDNTTQSGRPLLGTSIEVTGIDYTTITQISQFYKDDVSGQSGAWGGIIPNINPNGVQSLVEYNRTDGTIAETHTSANGIWGGTNTVNPTGGLTNVLVIADDEKTLTIKVFTEGLYDSFSGLLRKAQDVDLITYAYVDKFGGDTADVVTLELWTNTGAMVFSDLVGLSTSGTIVLTLDQTYDSDYFIYIRHRNSIPVSTPNAISFSGNSINHDFTTSASQAYFDNQIMLASGIYGMFGGDVDQDGSVGAFDMIAVDNSSRNFLEGYFPEDVNGDAEVGAFDLIIVDNNSRNFVFEYLPY